MLPKPLCQQKWYRRGHGWGGKHFPFSCTFAGDFPALGAASGAVAARYLQALLPYKQKWPWRFRGHIEPCLVQMTVSHSSETPPGPRSFPSKCSKLYSLVMSQATDC